MSLKKKDIRILLNWLPHDSGKMNWMTCEKKSSRRMVGFEMFLISIIAIPSQKG